MRSHFSAQTLAEIFRDIYASEKTGVLILNRDNEEKHVVFERGMIMFADSTIEEEKLGNYLVQEGQLSTGALSEVTDNLNGSSSVRDLAQLLVNRELIGRATVRRAETELVTQVVESVFRWEGGSARFSEEPQAPSIFETDILNTVETILRGIFCMAGFSPIHEAMTGLDNRLKFRRPTAIPVERLTLSPSHGFILSRVDGNTSLNDVISILPPDEEEMASRFLFGLLVMSIIEYDPPLGSGGFRVSDLLRDHADRQALERMQEQTVIQAYSQIRDQNPHEVLGVTPAATHAEIESAYEKTKAQFARERLLPNVRESLKSQLTLIESRLIESYLTLTRPDSNEAKRVAKQAEQLKTSVGVDDLNVRVEMDKAKAKVEIEQQNRHADTYFAKARQYQREADFHNAIQYAKLAISHNASDARFYSLMAECQARNPEARWQRNAELNFTKATQLDPWNSTYWINLGQLYKRQGLKLRAKKQFEEALKLVPDNEELLAEIKSLG